MAAVTNPYDRPRVRLGPPSLGTLAGLFGLWTLVGVLGSVSILGMLTIGAFVLPFAMLSGALALWLTMRGRDRWPSIAGLGLALGLAITWLGVVQGGSAPSSASGSCTSTPDGGMTCESGGVPYDPNAFDLGTAAPWFTAGLVVAVAALVAFVLLSRGALTRGAVRSP